MPLDFEIESVDDLDESVKGLYVEHEGKYRLDVKGIDPADELKEALRKEREEAKRFKEKASAFEKEKSEAEKARAKEKGEFESLYNSTQAELEAERRANKEFKERIQSRDISEKALKIAAGLTKDVSRAELLQEKIANMSRYTDDGIKYELGGIEVDASKVISHLSENYPFLVDGNQANGGGAPGGQGSGAAKTMSRQDFNDLSQHDRKNFIKSGGTLID